MNKSRYQFSDYATISFRRRTDRPEEPSTLARRVEAFAEKRKLSDAASAVLRVILDHHAQTGKSFAGDGFDLAKKAGLEYDVARKARSELESWNAIRSEANNQLCIHGLLPGDAWTLEQNGGRR